MPNTDMVALLRNLMAIAGAHTGTAIKNAIDELISTHEIDVNALQAKIGVIQNILDADPSTPEYDQAQNIITSLNSILSRLAVVETTISRLEGNESVAGSVDFKIAAERARAVAAEQANAACCATNASDLEAHVAAYDSFVTSTNASLSSLAADIAENTQAIDTLTANAAASEGAINATLTAIQEATGANEDDIADLNTLVEDVISSTGLNSDGSFNPETVSLDAANIYEYIHDVAADGADRAGDLRRAIRKLARRSRLADNALDARLDVLEGDASVPGSILQIITTAVNAEKTRAETSEAALAQTISDNATASATAIAALQTQIDDLSGGGTGSVQSVRDELGATITGSGLETDGSYSADATTEYLGSATSLKDADKKLDTAIKGLESNKADRSEVVLSSDIAAINYSALGAVFLETLNCALAGGSDCYMVEGPDEGIEEGYEEDLEGDGAVI